MDNMAEAKRIKLQLVQQQRRIACVGFTNSSKRNNSGLQLWLLEMLLR